jgi:apolipoprotein N-acyltransferase
MPATESALKQQALRRARSAVRLASDGIDAWRSLAQAAPAAGEVGEGVRAWTEVSRLEERTGRYVAALAALRRAQALGGDVFAERARVRRRLWVALGSVALSALLVALALPPLSLWPLGLVAIVPLYLTVAEMVPWVALVYGWLAGLTINLYGFAWSVGLMGRFGHLSAPYAIAALLVACAYQALVFGLWTGGCALLARRARVPWIVAAPLVFALLEAALPFIFPWYLAVTVWRAWPLLQVAELGGPTAVSALVVLVNLVLAEVWRARARRQPVDRSVRIAAGLAGTVIVLGLGRAGHVAWLRAWAPHLRVGVVQTNLGTVSEDDRKVHGQEYIDALRAETDELGRRGAQLVVWPESSFPFLFDRALEREFAADHPWALRDSYRGAMLVGALTHTFGVGRDIYNSALLLAPDGSIAGRYDKVRLMPFGEYVPFADRFPAWAERVRKRMPDSSDIRPGKGPAVLSDGALRVAPMICYEDILPETTQDLGAVHPAPNLLVTLANHAWFGDSLAPREAFALATIRSVELRRDLVRATTTGVSSIGDALGRVRVESRLVGASPGRVERPDLLEGEVALVDGFALGPWGTRAFPYAVAATLAACVWRRRRRAAP